VCVRACPTVAVECHCRAILGRRFAEKHYETAWGPEKRTCYQCRRRSPVEGNCLQGLIKWLFLSNSKWLCFLLSNYNKFCPRRWELNGRPISKPGKALREEEREREREKERLFVRVCVCCVQEEEAEETLAAVEPCDCVPISRLYLQQLKCGGLL
jgi:hypothetical protein